MPFAKVEETTNTQVPHRPELESLRDRRGCGRVWASGAGLQGLFFLGLRERGVLVRGTLAAQGRRLVVAQEPAAAVKAMPRLPDLIVSHCHPPPPPRSPGMWTWLRAFPQCSESHTLTLTAPAQLLICRVQAPKLGTCTSRP